jgi:tetratricopeptide (TPR) repeat protein
MRLAFLLGFVFCVTSAFSQTETDSLLNELSNTIEHKEEYIQAKLNRIDKFKKQVRGNSDQMFYAQLKVYNEYRTFIYDSAFDYARKLQRAAYKSKDPLKVNYSKIKLGFVLLSSGMYKETLDSLLTVRSSALPDTIKVEFYSLVARAYYDLVDFNSNPYYSELYNKLGHVYIDSALNLLDGSSQQFLSLRGLKNLKTNNLDKAIYDFEELIEKFELNDPELAIAASTLSYTYTKAGHPEKAMNLLCQAAMADIRSCTKETVAILNLAEILYKKGDIKRAYKYIKEAMDAANYYGARHRKIQVGAIFPIIEGAELNTVEAQRKMFFLYSAIVTALTVITIVFAFIVYKQFKKLQAAKKLISAVNENLMEINTKLREADKIKEEYIGYYFNINTEYLAKIENFKKAVDLKLMTKKFDDIKYIVNNINLKKEREELYYSFDKVFLKLFPDFVTTFNSYFKEEDRIVLKEDQLLTTELRIFALIRMGISDSEKIAKILDYSVNTIYAYKTRVKSKSILPNDEFEKRIMEIRTLGV